MASPQTENGFTRISNEIMEALCHIRISGEARQILDTIIRKTYGWNKKEDIISLSQFCLATGLSKSRVCHSLLKLAQMGLIAKKGNGMSITYRFNKDFDTWKALPKKESVAKKGNSYCQKRKKSLPIIGHTKDNKDIITKDIITSNPEIKIFIDFAYEQFKVKTGEPLHIIGGKDGKTIKSLLGTYDLEKLKNLWETFLQSKDPFILQAGFSIGVFQSQITKLLSQPNANKCVVCHKTEWKFLKNTPTGAVCNECLKS